MRVLLVWGRGCLVVVWGRRCGSVVESGFLEKGQCSWTGGSNRDAMVYVGSFTWMAQNASGFDGGGGS